MKQKTLWDKGENAGYQHFLLYTTMFSKVNPVMAVKTRDDLVRVQ